MSKHPLTPDEESAFAELAAAAARLREAQERAILQRQSPDEARREQRAKRPAQQPAAGQGGSR
jgi:hypothetical protein